MNFDEIIDRRGTQCEKWDLMEKIFSVSPEDGLAMWVADTDFRAPQVAIDALQKVVDHGVIGYPGDESSYNNAVCWWLENRHGWEIQPDWIISSAGMVNGIALAVDTFTEPEDGILIFTPVYHAFARVIKAQNRTLVECPLSIEDGKYKMDFATYEGQMTGKEKMLILCSPQNPGGRVWTREELTEVVTFAKRHDLMIVSDEIHQDLVYPDHKHIPTALIEGASERLIALSAPSKTFNVAGATCGQVIIPDLDIRKKFYSRKRALGIPQSVFGLRITEALYSEGGANWVDEACAYLDQNRQIFETGVSEIPGVNAMQLEGTYLSWVDFSGTGMEPSEIRNRIAERAKIAASPGGAFGLGGERFMRFNLGLPKSRIEEAVERLHSAFSDLQ